MFCVISSSVLRFHPFPFLHTHTHTLWTSAEGIEIIKNRYSKALTQKDFPQSLPLAGSAGHGWGWGGAGVKCPHRQTTTAGVKGSRSHPDECIVHNLEIINFWAADVYFIICRKIRSWRKCKIYSLCRELQFRRLQTFELSWPRSRKEKTH